MDDLDRMPDSTNWCANGGEGCERFQDSKRGIKRYTKIKKKWEEYHENEHETSSKAGHQA